MRDVIPRKRKKRILEENAIRDIKPVSGKPRSRE